MSTPIRGGDGVDDPLIYAPRWARSSQPDRPALASYDHATPTSPETKPETTNALRAAAITKAAASITQAAITRSAKERWIADAPSMVITDLTPMAPGIGGPNIELPPPRLRAFEGDIAIQDLWRCLALNPNILPQPPVQRPREPMLPWIGRFVFLLLMVATVAFGVMLLANSPGKQLRVVAGAALLDDPVTPATALQPAKMIVESQRAFANEPLPLGVWLNDASGAELLTMVGLATGTRLSAGTPLGTTGWQVSGRDLGMALAYAPKDFVGVMDAAIDLRSRDRLVDSQTVRLEWVANKEPHLALPPDPKPPAAAVTLNAQEVAALIKRAEDFVRGGDIASARIALRRAASAGDAQSSLALAKTFDPTFLSEHGVLGFGSDVAQARQWYEKAMQLGSTEASRRLERLAAVQ